jgi:cation/acetate symporter
MVFAVFVGITLALSFYFGSRTRSAQGYFAAGGQIHWFVNGIAFAGDYLSAASFLGICGMIAMFGYDGFLYSIGYLAGWVVALFVIAEPLKRLGRYTFADALDARFQSRAIKLSAGISTLAVSVFYLIPQMVGAGALVKPLLGFPHAVGVGMVGAVVILIVVTAGMVSTTYVQFLKGSLLVIFSTILTVLILNRGLSTQPGENFHTPLMSEATEPVDPAKVLELLGLKHAEVLPAEGGWTGRPYVRTRDTRTGQIAVWRKLDAGAGQVRYVETQRRTQTKSGEVLANGIIQGTKEGQADFYPVGHISKLPGGQTTTGPVSAMEFIRTIDESEIVLWREDKQPVSETDGSLTTVYYPQPTAGNDVLRPGNSSTFAGVRAETFAPKLNFLSLMLALFCGTASLPHILIRYYTVKDQASARKSTVVGIGSIGFFYVLTLFMGLGAMTGGVLDPVDIKGNMAAPLLAKSYGDLLFAVISAIAFTTVLGTVAGLIVAASGAVVHDLLSGYARVQMTDHEKVRIGRFAAVGVGVIAIVLGILFEKMNVTFLVGWAFSVAASANLPSLVMLLFWKRTTKQGITAAIVVGMVSSLAWILLSGDTYKDVYGLPPESALVPFSQPGIVTIPLGFLALIIVSLLTGSKAATAAEKT